jgi:hypothetical protein
LQSSFLIKSIPCSTFPTPSLNTRENPVIFTIQHHRLREGCSAQGCDVDITSGVSRFDLLYRLYAWFMQSALPQHTTVLLEQHSTEQPDRPVERDTHIHTIADRNNNHREYHYHSKFDSLCSCAVVGTQDEGLRNSHGCETAPRTQQRTSSSRMRTQKINEGLTIRMI